ncbi:MAG: hypothetical protein WC462_03545 [archaeon]
MVRTRKARIHLTFGSHADNEKFIRNRDAPLRRTKVVFPEFISANKNRFNSSFSKFEENARRRGVLVRNAEKGSTRAEEISLENSFRVDKKHEIALKHPSLRTAVDYFNALKDSVSFRHMLARKNIIEGTKRGKVEVRYGTAHSVLAAELRALGQDVSISMKPFVFSWDYVVLRKLLRNKEPTKLEYKRGLLSLRFSNDEKFLINLFQKRVMSLSESEMRFWHLLNNVMVGKLTEKEIDGFTKSRSLVVSLLNHFGLSNPNKVRGRELKKELVKFLDANSVFWRRQRNIVKLK